MFPKIPAGVFLCVFYAVSLPVFAQEDAGSALTLDDAAALAIAHQPLLDAQQSAALAARQSAVAAAQLPDPKLAFGLKDLPINTGTAYSLRQDNFTMLTLGVMQDFPRAEKRRLRGERGMREAEMAEQDLIATRYMIRREAALAWLEVWQAERAAELARDSARQSDLQAQAMEIAYRSGRVTQADLLAVKVESQRMRDNVADLAQKAAYGRNGLSRWIGASAYRRLSPDLPAWGAPPDLDTLLARLRAHPHLNTAAKQAEVAQTAVDLAKANYKPDWSVELDYGNRLAFSDFIGLNFKMDLPVFTADRQDRDLGAKLAEKDRAEQIRDDLWRQQSAQARQSLDNWQRLQERLKRYDQDILPQSERRVQAALAAWQSGQGLLSIVLDARRMALDDRLKRLELEAEAARDRINVQYFAGEQP